MKVVIFGSSGMVGQGALREALLDPGVTQVVCVVRKPSGQQHPKRASTRRCWRAQTSTARRRSERRTT